MGGPSATSDSVCEEDQGEQAEALEEDGWSDVERRKRGKRGIYVAVSRRYLLG